MSINSPCVYIYIYIIIGRERERDDVRKIWKEEKKRDFFLGVKAAEEVVCKKRDKSTVRNGCRNEGEEKLCYFFYHYFFY